MKATLLSLIFIVLSQLGPIFNHLGMKWFMKGFLC